MQSLGLRSALGLPATLALAGCPQLSLLHTARPLLPGEWRTVLGAGFYAFDTDGEDVESDSIDGVLPYFEGGFRRGLGERFDAGVRVSALSMLGFDVNWALLRTERVAISVDPSASVLLGPIHATYLWLPVLLDIELRGDTTLTRSARCGYASLDEDDAEDIGLEGAGDLVGFGVGLRRRVGSRLHLIPELHVVSAADGSLGEDALVAASLGFAW